MGMAGYLFRMFGMSLALTIVIELAVAWLSGMRRRKDMLLVALVNVLTNPSAVLCNWLCRLYLPDYRRAPVQLAIEAVVIITEALVYCGFAGDERWQIRKPVLFALAANGCSWLLGLLGTIFSDMLRFCK